MAVVKPDRFPSDSVTYLLSEFYRFKEVNSSSIKELNSWGDRNYYFQGLLTVENVDDVTAVHSASDKEPFLTSNNEFILKVFNWDDSSNVEFIQGIGEMMKFLYVCGYNCSFPVRAVSNHSVLVLDEDVTVQLSHFTRGQTLSFTTDDQGYVNLQRSLQQTSTAKNHHYCLMVLHYVPGEVAVNVPISNQLLFNIGRCFGSMNNKLQKFQNKAITERVYYRFDLKHLACLRQYIPSLKDPKKREICQKCIEDFETHVLSQLSALSQGIIHNDGNLMNIIVIDEKVNGVIDFGDCVHSCHIFELGILLVEAMGTRDKEPLTSITPVVSGYLDAFPITKYELDLLYYIVLGRTVQICINGEYDHQKSNNEYILDTVKQYWTLCHTLLKVKKEDFDEMWKKLI